MSRPASPAIICSLPATGAPRQGTGLTPPRPAEAALARDAAAARRGDSWIPEIIWQQPMIAGPRRRTASSPTSPDSAALARDHAAGIRDAVSADSAPTPWPPATGVQLRRTERIQRTLRRLHSLAMTPRVSATTRPQQQCRRRCATTSPERSCAMRAAISWSGRWLARRVRNPGWSSSFSMSIGSSASTMRKATRPEMPCCAQSGPRCAAVCGLMTS